MIFSTSVSRDHSHLASPSKIGLTCILDIEKPAALNLPSPVKLWEAVLNGVKSSALEGEKAFSVVMQDFPSPAMSDLVWTLLCIRFLELSDFCCGYSDVVM